jgi:3-hydroxyisobutyrate dehydrogenase
MLRVAVRSPLVSAVIGVLGVGRMGLPICARLVQAGHDVVAGDLRPDLKPAVCAVGARWADGTAVLAAAVDILITVLPGAPELEEATDAALAGLRRGAVWIDMTSAFPAVGERVRTRAARAGVSCLDAPLGGGVTAANNGTLQLYVGGPADAVERHRRVLEALGTVTHMGAHGAGYTTKLLINLLWFSQAVASAEALLVARRSGIDVELLRRAVQMSAARSEFIDRDLDALLDGDYLPTFGLDRCCEELDAVVRLAGSLDVPVEVGSTVRDVYTRALERYGAVDGELLAIALLEEEAGVRLRRDR